MIIAALAAALWQWSALRWLHLNSCTKFGLKTAADSTQVPDLSAAQARALFSAGWRDPAALALAEQPDVAKALVSTLPGSMRSKRSANGQAKSNAVSSDALSLPCSASVRHCC